MPYGHVSAESMNARLTADLECDGIRTWLQRLSSRYPYAEVLLDPRGYCAGWSKIVRILPSSASRLDDSLVGPCQFPYSEAKLGR